VLPLSRSSQYSLCGFFYKCLWVSEVPDLYGTEVTLKMRGS